MSKRRVFDTRGYLHAQTKEVLGPVNRYYTGLALGREPSPDDCWRHWHKSKAGEKFRQAHEHLFWIEPDR